MVAAGEELRLVVADDGQGMSGPASAGLGLRNMRQRAERLGGGVEPGTSREGGTRLTWHVLLGAVAERDGLRARLKNRGGRDGALAAEPVSACCMAAVTSAAAARTSSGSGGPPGGREAHGGQEFLHGDGRGQR